MCVTYTPTRNQQLEAFGVALLRNDDWPERTWQDYAAPIIRRNENGDREAILATYGMIPKWHIPAGVKKYTTINARAETVGQLRSFSSAWKDSHLCLVPMLEFFEPNWETGKHVPWRIEMADQTPFAVAGLWKSWIEEGNETFSFTQLTVNADDHPLMSKFHKPGEKRSLVIIKQDEYEDWLHCRDLEMVRTFLHTYPAELMSATEAVNT